MSRDLRNLTIQHSLENTTSITEVSSSMTAGEILNALAERINLPPGIKGTLIRKSTGEIIPSWQTLANVGVQDGESLFADFDEEMLFGLFKGIKQLEQNITRMDK